MQAAADAVIDVEAGHGDERGGGRVEENGGRGYAFEEKVLSAGEDAFLQEAPLLLCQLFKPETGKIHETSIEAHGADV